MNYDITSNTNNLIDIVKLNERNYNQTNTNDIESVENFKRLEMCLLSNEYIILLNIDNSDYNFNEINTNFIKFIKLFINNEIEIKNFKLLKDFNGKRWNDLERRFQRRIENKTIHFNIIHKHNNKHTTCDLLIYDLLDI